MFLCPFPPTSEKNVTIDKARLTLIERANGSGKVNVARHLGHRDSLWTTRWREVRRLWLCRTSRIYFGSGLWRVWYWSEEKSSMGADAIGKYSSGRYEVFEWPVRSIQVAGTKYSNGRYEVFKEFDRFLTKGG